MTFIGMEGFYRRAQRARRNGGRGKGRERKRPPPRAFPRTSAAPPRSTVQNSGSFSAQLFPMRRDRGLDIVQLEPEFFRSHDQSLDFRSEQIGALLAPAGLSLRDDAAHRRRSDQ